MIYVSHDIQEIKQLTETMWIFIIFHFYTHFQTYESRSYRELILSLREIEP